MAVALTVTCRVPKEAPSPPAPLPAQTLYRLKWAYNAPDAGLHGTLFDRERFEREATVPPREPPSFPERWTFREEERATAVLMAEAYHVLLEMDVTPAAVGAAPPGASVFKTPPVEVRLRVWRDPTYCMCAEGKVTFLLGRRRPEGPWLIRRLTDATGPEYATIVTNEQTGSFSWTEILTWYLAQGREANARR